MKNKKHALVIAAASLLTTLTVHASPPDSSTTGEVIFSGTVEEQCGIEATEASADLAFGDAYNSSKAQVKLISNSGQHVHFKASTIDTSSFESQIESKDVYFKTEGTIAVDQNADEWLKKTIIERDDIKQNNHIDLLARVNIDEGDLDANDNYEIKTTWTIECH
ncbi:hypothetical protein [Aliivibrio sifiae]|uniref:Uncharacterized protein n=1 Tax=Aliivibrio sifiae TaxID=566293 RepID=A0A2S7X5Y8_9GAMM|nr:hypothetical protein [Aliivibrio sifiae]PQJ86743.1 hypothetical protein BTO23_11390 [Aliivibrio sifiae]GLR74152.1 hypothetical protein GCM10007855_10260 [Aliivibrio sifiae]